MSDDEQPASDEPKPLSEWARKRAAGKARRAKVVERRETYFDLLMSSYSVPQIAKAMKMSVAAVRRAIAQALADRRLDSQEDHARLQVARLNKALRHADVLLEEGDAKAIPQFVKIVAELDRYHGLVQPMRPGKAARRLRTSRLAPPPLALSHAPEASHGAPSIAGREAGVQTEALWTAQGGVADPARRDAESRAKDVVRAWFVGPA